MAIEIELIGLLAGFCTTGSFIPQIVKVHKTRSAKDFSWAWVAIFTIGVLLWLAYGLFLQSLAITLANGFTTIFLFAIIYYKIRRTAVSVPV